jgi:hypothetical protein
MLLGEIFMKKFQKHFEKFFVGRKVFEILKKNSRKKIFPKNIFFKKTKRLFII